MKILHIGQTHKLPFEIKRSLASLQEEIEEVASSQFKVAEIIRQHPECPVVSENECWNRFRDDGYVRPKDLEKIFPLGLPKKFSELTFDQKKILHEYGAVDVLFWLGEIPAVYKSIRTKETRETVCEALKSLEELRYKNSDHIIKQYQDGIKHINTLSVLREKETIECIEEAAYRKFKTLRGVTVIVVYGAKHNFKTYCDEKGYEHELIDCSWHEQQNVWQRMLIGGAFALGSSMLLGVITIGVILSSGVSFSVIIGVATAIIGALTIPGSVFAAIALLGLVFGVGALIGYLTGRSEVSPSPLITSLPIQNQTAQEESLQKRMAELERLIQEEARQAEAEQESQRSAGRERQRIKERYQDFVDLASGRKRLKQIDLSIFSSSTTGRVVVGSNTPEVASK